jgi:SAM-dependent methyltransferase
MLGLKRLRGTDLRITDRGPTAFVLSSLAHYGLRALLLPRLRRDTEFVTNEYNHDHRDEYWKPSLSLDDFLFGNAQDQAWVLLDDRLVLGTCHDVRKRLLPRLRDRVQRYSKPGDLIVEFGAGTGRNLAYLARELPDRRYLGFELTPRSVEDARRTVDQFGLRVEMKVADVTQPVPIEGTAAVSFSVLALEQLPDDKSKHALQQMAAITTNAIVCFEPIRELYPYSVRGLTSRLRQYRADYVAGLPDHARALQLKTVIEERTGLALNALNEMCELVIEL